MTNRSSMKRMLRLTRARSVFATIKTLLDRRSFRRQGRVKLVVKDTHIELVIPLHTEDHLIWEEVLLNEKD